MWANSTLLQNSGAGGGFRRTSVSTEGGRVTAAVSRDYRAPRFGLLPSFFLGTFVVNIYGRVFVRDSSGLPRRAAPEGGRATRSAPSRRRRVSVFDPPGDAVLHLCRRQAPSAHPVPGVKQALRGRRAQPASPGLRARNDSYLLADSRRSSGTRQRRSAPGPAHRAPQVRRGNGDPG